QHLLRDSAGAEAGPREPVLLHDRGARAQLPRPTGGEGPRGPGTDDQAVIVHGRTSRADHSRAAPAPATGPPVGRPPAPPGRGRRATRRGKGSGRSGAHPCEGAVGPRVTNDRAALRRPGMLAGPAVASRAASLLNPLHCRALLFPLAVMSDRVGKEAVVEG